MHAVRRRGTWRFIKDWKIAQNEFNRLPISRPHRSTAPWVRSMTLLSDFPHLNHESFCLVNCDIFQPTFAEGISPARRGDPIEAGI